MSELRSDAEATISTVGLSKRYRSGVLALDNLTVSIPEGSITALVGPNGAGKSTLIRSWMGFERPSGGSVSVLGHDPARVPRLALGRVGYLAQSPALYAELSVRDHLELARHFKGAAFDRSLALQRLDDLRIDPRATAGSLSGGQAAQLGLALAIGMRARAMLLDEPLAHLDPLARREFTDVLAEHVGENGATVVLSSHIVSDIERACDRLLLLGAGRLLLDDSIETVLATHWLADGASRGALSRPIQSLEKPAATAVPAPLEDVVVGYLAALREETP